MYKVVIITVSDSSYYENKKDLSGPQIKEFLEERGYDICNLEVVPDEKDKISKLLVEISDSNKVDLILTTGGTGFNERDVTPEATMAVIEKYAPGFGELMRMKSFEITKNAILSREAAGIRKKTLIINLPGSPKAAIENLSFIVDSLGHGLKMLSNQKNDCGNMNHLR
ncbi:MAG: MogA/MoaB family molybdenum cofactor biosynthesis protein [Fusobacterium sp.]|nr:MogA/MoaB family molybdenum cofactor biosynthesis protein [Fusobacterium sp.]